MHGRSSSDPDFLTGGEMGSLMRAHDWSSLPIGDPANWPQSLRSVVGLMLGSKFPMFVAWGPELGFLYNDPYAEILGGKHPAALGRRFHDIWAEIWDDISPLIDAALRGEATYRENLPLVMNRKGHDERTWFTFSYSPVRDESGAVAGMYCVCTETTSQVLAERRLRENEAEARGVLEGMGEGFILLDRDFRIRRINDEGLRIDGRSREEIVGHHLLEVWPEAERMPPWPMYQRAMAERVPTEAVYRHASDLQDVWLEVRAYPSGDGLAVFYRDVTDTKRAERALRESEDHYRHAVELNPQTVWTSGPDGQLDRVGHRWTEWTGTSGLGSSWGEAVHPDDLPPSVEAWTRSVTTGVPYDIEHRVRMRDGAFHWMRSRAYPRRDDQGRIVKWYGTTEDVHEARIATDRLRESEARFRNMADHAPVMMWVTDPNGHCTYLNRRWYEFTGQSEAEAEGFGWLDATHPDDKAEAERAFMEANAARAPFRAEYRLLRKDGAYRWAIDSASPRFGEDGAYLGYVGSVIDIDERREAESALRASTARAEALAAEQAAILGQLAEGVIVTDRAGRITFVNEAAARIHGVSRLDVEPDAYSEAYHLLTIDGELYPSSELPLARAVLEGETITEARWRIRRPDGSEVLAVGSARPVLDNRGGRLGAVLTLRDDTERDAAERSLRENEARLRALTDNLPSGMVYQIATGRDGSERRFLYVSQSHDKLTGVPAEAVIADPSIPYHLVLPEDRPGVAEAEARAIRDRKPFDVQVRFRRADGEVRWSRIISAPRAMPDGSLMWDGLQIDITDQKGAEERLREESRVLEVLNRTGEALAAELDLERLVQMVTDAGVELSGARFGAYFHNVMDETGERLHLFTLSGAERAAFERMGRPRATAVFGPTFRNEGVIRSDDILADPRYGKSEPHRGMPKGHLPVRSYLAVPVVSRSGEVLGGLLFGHPEPGRFSERHERLMVGLAAQAAVAVDNARLFQAVQRAKETLEQRVAERTAERDRIWRLSQDLLGVADAEGHWVSVNPAWARALGWEEADILGRTSEWLEHPDDREKTRAEVARLAAGGTSIAFENRLRSRDGSHRWLSWTAVPETGLLYCVARDVTAEKERQAELEQAQEALRQAQKMEAVGQLTGGIAHDFNNLLAGIVGSLDLMQTRIAQGRTDALERYAKAAMSSAQRAAALTHRLLAFSRRQPLDPKPVNANALVTGMEDLIRRTVGPLHALELVTSGGLWTTLCDPNQLESAILNLSINARDAMPDGGKLTIETCNAHLDDAYAAAQRDVTPGQYICICVTDTGTGMPPDVIARAFEPFFTTKPIGQGTGLGLSMVYGFAKQSEGHLKIYSEVGQGTTVKIYLPRFRGAADEEEIAGSAGATPRAEAGETVLVVEDEPVIRALVVEVLEDLGYRALEAADGPTGLKILSGRERIDLVVTDVGLPGLNGRQLADHARQKRPDLKVLFITGYAENATLANGFLDPGMEMITKPFAVEALAAKITGMIRNG